MLTETLLGIPTTAHILGGCCMGSSAETGVIDHRHRVFGYDGLYVIDGAAVSANPGVNPSLTITAPGRAGDELHPAADALGGGTPRASRCALDLVAGDVFVLLEVVGEELDELLGGGVEGGLVLQVFFGTRMSEGTSGHSVGTATPKTGSAAVGASRSAPLWIASTIARVYLSLIRAPTP